MEPNQNAFRHNTVTLLDSAEQYILEQVKARVAETVQKTLSEEFNALVQDKLNEVFSEILFELWEEKDPMRMSDNLVVMLEWAKCRHEKKKYMTETMVKEVEV